MTPIHVADDIAQALHNLSERQHRSLDDVLRQMIQRFDDVAYSTPSPDSDQALMEMAGMFKDDISDMSMTVRETMMAYFGSKHADPD